MIEKERRKGAARRTSCSRSGRKNHLTASQFATLTPNKEKESGSQTRPSGGGGPVSGRKNSSQTHHHQTGSILQYPKCDIDLSSYSREEPGPMTATAAGKNPALLDEHQNDVRVNKFGTNSAEESRGR